GPPRGSAGERKCPRPSAQPASLQNLYAGAAKALRPEHSLCRISIVRRQPAVPAKPRPGPASTMNAYILSAAKAYRRHLQYRAAHVVNNVASAIFGFMYIAIWQAATGGTAATGDYEATNMARWVAFNQVMLWAAVFLTNGLGIPETVR